MPRPQTERLGVSALEYFFAAQGWLFREQTTQDYGIDAHIEIVEKERPTGKLIALQIKAGASFFDEESADAYVFRTDDKHIAYWVGHSMPVAIVLFNPATKQAFCQSVSKETVHRTGKGWKILVPKINMLEDPQRTIASLAALTQPEPYVRRLNRLRIDRRWMDLLQQGAEVRVQFEDWVNKSLPRYKITISAEDEVETWPTLYAPGVGLVEMLNHFFPWADFEVNHEAHRDGAEEDWMTQCYSWRDSETGEVFYSTSFEEWYTRPTGLVPVSENGETASYDLLLSLNDFGLSFLALDDYLSDPDAPEKIGFTLE